MSQQSRGVYLLQQQDDDNWARPTPAGVAVRTAVAEQTPLDEDGLDSLDTYVDLQAVEALVDGDRDDPVTFTVESHEVTIDDAGTITVE